MSRLVLPLMMYKESVEKGVRKSHYVVPTWNHLYKIGRGRVFLDDWAKKYKQEIEILTLNWKQKNRWKMAVDRKVYVDVWIWWPDATARDCHNIDKLMMDVFEDAGIYNNDANALLRYQDFSIDIENPRIEVEFTLGDPFDRKEVADKLRKELKQKNKTKKSAT